MVIVFTCHKSIVLVNAAISIIVLLLLNKVIYKNVDQNPLLLQQSE